MHTHVTSACVDRCEAISLAFADAMHAGQFDKALQLAELSINEQLFPAFVIEDMVSWLESALDPSAFLRHVA